MKPKRSSNELMASTVGVMLVLVVSRWAFSACFFLFSSSLLVIIAWIEFIAFSHPPALLEVGLLC